MARAFVDDPLLSFNFALIDIPVVAAIPIVFATKLIKSALANGTFVGMSQIDLPTLALNTREIPEGNSNWTHTVATGHASGGECVLKQAVFPAQVDMYVWMAQAIAGMIAPRRHFLVAHLRTDKRLPVRAYLLSDCLPINWQPSTTLNASASEVCMETLTMHVGRLTVVPLSPEI